MDYYDSFYETVTMKSSDSFRQNVTIPRGDSLNLNDTIVYLNSFRQDVTMQVDDSLTDSVTLFTTLIHSIRMKLQYRCDSFPPIGTGKQFDSFPFNATDIKSDSLCEQCYLIQPYGSLYEFETILANDSFLAYDTIYQDDSFFSK